MDWSALACAIMGFPLMIRAIKASIEMIDIKYEEAAKTMGANKLVVFISITLPLALPGIVAGLLYALLVL